MLLLVIDRLLGLLFFYRFYMYCINNCNFSDAPEAYLVRGGGHDGWMPLDAFTRRFGPAADWTLALVNLARFWKICWWLWGALSARGCLMMHAGSSLLIAGLNKGLVSLRLKGLNSWAKDAVIWEFLMLDIFPKDERWDCWEEDIGFT